MPIQSRPYEDAAIFLDQVDPTTRRVVAYVGCRGDLREARRLRASEAITRGIPESCITFSSAKES